MCIDGPEFDGALVDWDEMFKRMGTFKDVEREEMEHFEEHLATVEAAKKKESTDVTMDVEPTNESVAELTNRDAEWRKALRASMKPKERTAIERVKMPELDPVYRATTRTEEVNIGLTKEMALTEAKRCLDCPKPSCMEGCPVNINIPSFVKNIERGQFLAAAKVLKNTSALPAVCGRVCPQEKQTDYLFIPKTSVLLTIIDKIFLADFLFLASITKKPLFVAIQSQPFESINKSRISLSPCPSERYLEKVTFPFDDVVANKSPSPKVAIHTLP